MKTVIVTGAARGIGRAIGEAFLAEGWRPLLVDVDKRVGGTARALAEQATVPVDGVVADIATEEGRAAVAAALTADQRLGALVNNAGITRDAMIHKMTEEQFRAVLRVSLGAAYSLTTELVPRMGSGGAVVTSARSRRRGTSGSTTTRFRRLDCSA